MSEGDGGAIGEDLYHGFAEAGGLKAHVDDHVGAQLVGFLFEAHVRLPSRPLEQGLHGVEATAKEVLDASHEGLEVVGADHHVALDEAVVPRSSLLGNPFGVGGDQVGEGLFAPCERLEVRLLYYVPHHKTHQDQHQGGGETEKGYNEFKMFRVTHCSSSTITAVP